VVREQIVRLVYLDALGQIPLCPNDINFLTWLFVIAHGRVSEYVRGSVVGAGVEIPSPIFDGAGMVDGVYDDESILKQRAETFFSGLTFEERDIIRLKFFEELTDGEVMYILNIPEMKIGTRIYQVLRRGYEILFGKVEDSAVYYGELYSFLARLKSIEKIPVPENLKLKLKIEVKEKAEKNYGEKFGKEGSEARGSGLRAQGLKPEDSNRFGSSDPAKIFVQAAKGMSREEVDQITKEYVEKREKRFEKKDIGEEFVEGSGRGSAKEFAKEPAEPVKIYPDAEALGGAFPEAGVSEAEFPGGVFPGAELPSVEFPSTAVPGFETAEPVPVQYIGGEEFHDDFEKREKAERFLDFWDKWKYVMSLVPSGLFVLGVIAVLGVVLFGGVKDDGVTGLKFKVDYGIGFEETNREDVPATVDYDKKALIENSLIAKIAEGKDVDYVKVWGEEGGIGMNFKLKISEEGGEASGGEIVSGLEYLFSEVEGDGSGVNYRVKKFKKL
jgi:DNA-directed RNA polymerase specialized sigma24 family protein